MNFAYIPKFSNYLRQLIFLFTTVILFAACKTTYLQESINVSQQKSGYNKIVVIAKTKSNMARVNFEDRIVQQLKAKGINAIASRNVGMAPKMGAKLTDAEVARLTEQLIAEGFDGAIITQLISSENYVQMNQSSFTPGGRYGYYGRFSRYYNYYEPMSWDSDISSGVRYSLESSLYALNTTENDNLQWVGQFKISDPSNIANIVDKYAQELADELVEKSISVANN